MAQRCTIIASSPWFPSVTTTTLLNVNQALLKAGHADVVDFPNEFHPATWALRVRYPIEVSQA